MVAEEITHREPGKFFSRKTEREMAERALKVLKERGDESDPRYVEIRNELVLSVQFLIKHKAKRVKACYPKHLLDDLFQAGMLEAVAKFPKFKPEKGCRLATFLGQVCWRAMRDFANKKDSLIYLPDHFSSEENRRLADAARNVNQLILLREEGEDQDGCLSGNDSSALMDLNAVDPMEASHRREEEQKLNEEVQKLRRTDPVEWRMLRKRLAGETLGEIGEAEGICKTTASKKIELTLNRLREKLTS